MKYLSYHFCPHCGLPLQTSSIGGRLRANCPECSFVDWGSYSLGVGGILWHENKILLVQRAYNPGRGMWTIPGGYVEQGERLEDAVAREIREETGVESEATALLAVRDRPAETAAGNTAPSEKAITSYLQPHDLYVIFLMRYLDGTPEPDHDEVLATGFLTLDECRTLSVAPLTLHTVEASARELAGFHSVEGIKMLGQLSKLYHLVE